MSADGTTWNRVDPAGDGDDHPIEYRTAVAGGPGLLVLGEGSGPASPDTMLFTSPDGRSWTALGSAHPFVGTIALGMAVDGGTIHVLVEDWDEAVPTFRQWTGTAQP